MFHVLSFDDFSAVSGTAVLFPPPNRLFHAPSGLTHGVLPDMSRVGRFPKGHLIVACHLTGTPPGAYVDINTLPAHRTSGSVCGSIGTTP